MEAAGQSIQHRSSSSPKLVPFSGGNSVQHRYPPSRCLISRRTISIHLQAHVGRRLRTPRCVHCNLGEAKSAMAVCIMIIRELSSGPSSRATSAAAGRRDLATVRMHNDLASCFLGKPWQKDRYGELRGVHSSNRAYDDRLAEGCVQKNCLSPF